MRLLLAVVVFGLLSACSIGIEKDRNTYPTIVFEVAGNYQAIYRLTDRFARECHQGNGWTGSAFIISGNLYQDIHAAELVIDPKGGWGREVARVDIVQAGEQVKVTAKVWGKGIWDQRELNALRSSLTSGHISCR